MSRAFAARGWKGTCVDLIRDIDPPAGFDVWIEDVLNIASVSGYDFIWASSPCEEFSVHGMAHFHPKPKYPAMGIRLFNHARELCEASGIPYVMENVAAAQWFVGESVHNCGSFHLWGTGVPPLMPQGIKKGLDMGRDPLTGKRTLHLGRRSSYGSKARARDKIITATIPCELANCVADYAEAICSTQTETVR